MQYAFPAVPQTLSCAHRYRVKGSRRHLKQVLQNLVNLLGIPSSLNFAVMGSVILIGVLADNQFNRYRERKRQSRMANSVVSGAEQTG